jgi:hypothetical protein
MDKLISKLIEEIIRRIPAGTKPVDYLTDMLNTSRESAYRRLRNEVPFTFGEVALLTRQLDISLDEIMEIDKQGRIIMDLHIDAYSKPDKNFQILFEKYYKYIDGISKAQNQSTAISSNRISLILLMKYDALFKFFYFKYIHQMGNTHRSQEMFFNSRFSDIPISSEVEDIRQKFMESIAELDNVTAIYGNDLFLSTVRDIR